MPQYYELAGSGVTVGKSRGSLPLTIEVVEFLHSPLGAEIKGVHGAKFNSFEEAELRLSQDLFVMTGEFVSPITNKKVHVWIRYGGDFFHVCYIPVPGLILQGF